MDEIATMHPEAHQTEMKKAVSKPTPLAASTWHQYIDQHFAAAEVEVQQGRPCGGQSHRVQQGREGRPVGLVAQQAALGRRQEG